MGDIKYNLDRFILEAHKIEEASQNQESPFWITDKSEATEASPGWSSTSDEQQITFDEHQITLVNIKQNTEWTTWYECLKLILSMNISIGKSPMKISQIFKHHS